ncbi:MAG: sulfur oxidation c-type cytochrome SoxX [Candidatus Sedimenticola sp. (ex Thyasira tokunagai)]
MMIRIGRQLVIATSALAVLIGGVTVASSAIAAGSSVEEGKKIALHRKKGNCMTCHMIVGVPQPGNVAPPLIAIKARYPDKAKLRAQIWDATAINRDSPMPPYGKYKVLTESEIDKVTDYVHSL